ncbi:MAG: D-alanyl-D-alanine carboxypeptidase [Marinicaulis sp.]|nr:D-alanyl-D-alanine carboxypeptidase [Marinicaulis sp.]
MNLHRCVVAVLSAFLAIGVLNTPASANSKYAAYVIHADSGDILFDRYSTARRYPASLTKMMTLYLLFEELEAGNLTLKSKLKVSKTAAGQPPSKLGLKAGSTITVETAIQALAVKSANDVAVVVAEHISGSEWRFASKMTNKARSFGMKQTRFRNASGLPNSKQITTARDMAVLGRRVMQDFPEYYKYFGASSFKWNGRTYSTHNKLVKTYKGADGIKTGYTRRSGYNLVTTAEKDGVRLIGVVLGGRSGTTRNRHMRDILNAGFAKIENKPTLVAALHRTKPEPRIKPTLMAQLDLEKIVPTIANNNDLRNEIQIAAASLSNVELPAPNPDNDQIGNLIAVAETDDFNEFQRARLASLAMTDDGFVGQGDRQEIDEFSHSIQIGAYTSKAMAQKELEEAAFAGGMMERTRTVLTSPRDGGGILYRARITRLSEIEATLACASLADKDIACFVVSDSEMKTQ